MIVYGKEKIARLCIRCDKRFIPTGRSSRICGKCDIRVKYERIRNRKVNVLKNKKLKSYCHECNLLYLTKALRYYDNHYLCTYCYPQVKKLELRH